MATKHCAWRGFRQCVAPAALILLFAGCSADFDKYQEAIGKFQAATVTTEAASKEYLLSLNTFERQVELVRLGNEPLRTLDVTSGLDRADFSPEAIQARMAMFKVLKDYTGALAAIAGSSADAEWTAAVGKLKTSADTALAAIGSAAAGVPSQTVQAFTTPLAAIAGAIGTEYINWKRTQALDRAITAVQPEIALISKALKDDLEGAFRLRTTAAEEPITDASLAYGLLQEELRQRLVANGRNVSELEAQQLFVVSDPTAMKIDERRRAVLARLSESIETRDSIAAAKGQVLGALAAFDKAHGKLVAFAQSDKGPQSLGDLIAAVEEYKGAAEAAFVAFQRISALTQT